MKICLIGYGKMGKAVEKMALKRGHEIIAVIDDQWETLPKCDMAIEFTTPKTAYENIKKAIAQGIPIVSGTTGWLNRYDDIIIEVDRHEGAFFYASNFSVGIYLFRKLNLYLAKLMNHFPEYKASVNEVHHIHKIDYPSGTALTLAHDIIEQIARLEEFQSYLYSTGQPESSEKQLPIVSIRKDEVPGVHTIIFDGPNDKIMIQHEAKSRDGLALGAIIAAEFLRGKKGVYGMEELLNNI